MKAELENKNPVGETLPEASVSRSVAGRWQCAEMVGEVWRYRELLHQMVLRDIRLRYKQAVMGFAWALFMPVLIVASGFLVKIAMAHISGQPLDPAGIACMAVKAMVWSFFAGCLSFSSASLTGNINLVTKIYFPREILPMSAVFTQLFDSFIGSLGLAALLFLGLGVVPSWNMLWCIPLIVLLFCFTLGISLLISCANVFYRDVKYIVQVIIMFGIFFTPVFYEPVMFGPTGSRLMMLNPLTPIMEGMRLSTVGMLKSEQSERLPQTEKNDAPPLPPPATGVNLLQTLQSPDGVILWNPYYLLYSAVCAFAGLLLCWWYFHRMEFVMPEYI